MYKSVPYQYIFGHDAFNALSYQCWYANWTLKMSLEIYQRRFSRSELKVYNPNGHTIVVKTYICMHFKNSLTSIEIFAIIVDI